MCSNNHEMLTFYSKSNMVSTLLRVNIVLDLLSRLEKLWLQKKKIKKNVAEIYVLCRNCRV